MKISVILGHPYKKSFNNAIAETVVDALLCNKHEVCFHDLYKENFNPLVTPEELAGGIPDMLTEKHRSEIVAAEGIVIIHPNWWGQPPAILTGWIDKVLWNKVAYVFDEGDTGGGIPKGLLKAGSALVFNTSNTPEERENKVFGDPLERIWKDCVFDFCGIKNFYRTMFRVIDDSTVEQRKEWLREVRDTINRYYPEK